MYVFGSLYRHRFLGSEKNSDGLTSCLQNYVKQDRNMEIVYKLSEVFVGLRRTDIGGVQTMIS